MDTPPTKPQIEAAKEALLKNRNGSIDDAKNRKDVEPSDENVKHSKVLQYLTDNRNYIPTNGGSRRRRSRPSRKYKKSKRVFRKKSRSTRRR
jgi:hypothetical protein